MNNRVNAVFPYIVLSFFPALQTAGQKTNVVNAADISDFRKADSLDMLARKYMLSAKHDSAKIFLDAATDLALATKNPVIIARCYIDYVNLYNLKARYRDSEKYMQTARPYLEAINHYEIKFTGLLLQANLFSMIGKKDSAIYYYRRAEQFGAEHKQLYRNYVVYMALGELYNQLGDTEQAEKNLDIAYKLTAAKEGRPDHSYLLIVYINYLMAHKMAEKAGPFLREYTELAEQRKKSKFVDPLKDLLADVTNNKLEGSIEFMKDVREKCLKNDEKLNVVIADSYIARYYEKRKNYDEALKYVQEAEEFSAQSSSIQHLYLIRKLKFNLLQKSGNSDEANKMAASLFDLKDSILLLEKRQQVYELEAKYETEKKQREIQLLASQKEVGDKTIALLTADKKMASLLLQQGLQQNSSLERENLLMDSIIRNEKAYGVAVTNEKEKQQALNAALDRENKLKAAQLSRERNTKWGFAIGAGLLLLSGLAIMILYKKQQKKSSIIEKQSADLEVLMKEIHHRVKNNLQIVSSLLDLQVHYITDAQAVEAVKEGKNRVQSMALIHQNLYSEGNIKGIQVKEYVTNLLQTLCDSYNVTNDKVKISTRIDDLNLDVDTMIPLGLVINELVSNSFKYAFAEKQNGELEIMLKENGNRLHLMVKDNGQGFPEGMDVKNSKSFGLKMIKAFAQKLKAKLDIYNNCGAVVEMEISKFRTA